MNRNILEYSMFKPKVSSHRENKRVPILASRVYRTSLDLVCLTKAFQEAIYFQVSLTVDVT